eukprot:scaffold246883_cov62-Attheya_sp.AAC.2
MSSISKEGKDTIHIWLSHYKVRNYVSGVLLLKVLIRESHLDTNAMTTSIRRQLLGELHVFLPTIGHGITKFNQHVQLLIKALTAWGDTINDLLSNLFKGYLAASDKVFVLYMTRKQEEYEEGKAYNPKMITSLANTNRNGSDEERGKEGIGPAKPANKPGGQGDAKPNWLKHNRPPHQNEVNTPRNWNSLEYHWCHKETGSKCAGIWCHHTPKESKGIASKKRDFTKKPTSEKSAEAFKKRKLQLSKAYATVIEEGEDAADFE